MIYAHKDYRLEINKDKGKYYYKNKLQFQGFAFRALQMFIDNCDDANVKWKFQPQLTMREKCKFKKEEKYDKEKNL